MTEKGLLLQLFGNARGFVPKSKISTVEIDHPEKLFFMGQALKCRVSWTFLRNVWVKSSKLIYCRLLRLIQTKNVSSSV
jgi:hypothetical protein